MTWDNIYILHGVGGGVSLLNIGVFSKSFIPVKKTGHPIIIKKENMTGKMGHHLIQCQIGEGRRIVYHIET